MKKPTYIDLFCGAGGFSLGFDKTGFQNVFSIDIDPAFCQTYRANFPRHILLERNILTITKEEIIQLTQGNKIDVIVGGPPCQGFSMAGSIGRKFTEDPRNQLFKEFARFVSLVSPSYFVMENVARLYSHNGGQTREEIIALFNSFGYRIQCRILNAADYGVPQLRSRVIFIGSKVSNDILFPKKLEIKPKTVGQAIKQFPVLASGEASFIANHVAMKHSSQMLHKMSFISDGGDRTEIPADIRPQSGDIRKYIRYHSDRPSVCITGDMRKVFHYEQNRALTVRELAKIQSFPDDFIFKGTSISQQQQVGNAVPPLLAEAIAGEILQMIKTHE